jgi:iron complex outermembrane receptor protein
MKFFYTLYLLFLFSSASAQQTDTLGEGDLERVVIKAYEQNRQLKDVPAAISYINREGVERFGSAAIVHAVNTLPGVRMEERSPGSYRFNIRGSSLRSPFGVRNVKVYYNDLPFTDPGGQTYLNNLGSYNYNSIEIIKGPGSSLYGAGTGGVLLIESLGANEQPNVSAEMTTGSYGLKNGFIAVTTGTESAKNKISFQHQYSDGFRQHSALKRNILSWNGRFGSADKSLLKTTFLYSDLFYETPGALTKTEFERDLRMARPAGGGFPSAEQAQASIQQKTFQAGLSYRYRFSEMFSNTTLAYAMFTELRNPAIRNYGQNKEPHVGGRTSFSYKMQDLNLIAGGEIQQSFNSVFVYQNRAGAPDSLQSLDDISIRQSLLFLQGSFEKRGWEISTAGSLNFFSLDFKRTSPQPLPQQNRNFRNEFAPRLALARKWKDLTAYTSIARGFSPPTSAELLPSGSAINLGLNAEQGTNYDLGVKGRIEDVSFDINAFLFRLQNTIVQRRDAGGGDYFINAGKTKQRGIESSITYPLLKNLSFLRRSLLWLNHTWHHFQYEDFKQVTSDFSGNRLPGVAPHTISAGLEAMSNNGILANISYYFSDRIPLNDANAEYAASYHLLHARLGFEKQVWSQWRLKFVVGAENLLDQRYSLGNDINAFGGRYYNAAPGRSFYASLVVEVLTK